MMGKEFKEGFALEVVSVRLVRDAPILSETKIKTSDDVVHLVGEQLCGMDREVVCVINLKANNTPINCHFASMGSLNYSMAHPRELLKAGILSNAAGMILCHNHTSGNLLPSETDVKLTDQMQQVCELVGIPLWDHVIVGGDNSRYFSFHEKGLVKNSQKEYQTDYRKLEWDSRMEVAERGGRR
jgi:DNA repair protein RadC